MALAFSSRLTAAINRKPDIIFDYFIKVCLPHEASRYVTTTRSETKVTMSQYLAFVSRNLREDSLTEARQNVAIVVAQKGTKYFRPSAGVVGVYSTRTAVSRKFDEAGIKAADQENALATFWEKIGGPGSTPRKGITYNTWEGLLRRLTPTKSPQTILMRDIASLMASQVTGSGTTATYLSIMNLFGAFSQLMKVEALNRTFDSLTAHAATKLDSVSEDALLLHQEIRRLSDLRIFPLPEWYSGGFDSSGADDTSELNERSDSDDTEGANEAQPLLVAFEQWKRHFTESLSANAVSVHFLARVWSRFYYTILSTETEIRHRDMYLGWLTHRYIIAFLSAALTEEIIERDTAMKRYSLTNPVTSDNIFLSNLGRAMGIKDLDLEWDEHLNLLRERFPFFASLFSCPLWAAFLHPRVQISTSPARDISLINIQKKLWMNWLPENPVSEDPSLNREQMSTEVLAVTYLVLPRLRNQPRPLRAKFDNLFDPLNSVIVQTSARSSASSEDSDNDDDE